MFSQMDVFDRFISTIFYLYVFSHCGVLLAGLVELFEIFATKFLIPSRFLTYLSIEQRRKQYDQAFPFFIFIAFFFLAYAVSLVYCVLVSSIEMKVVLANSMLCGIGPFVLKLQEPRRWELNIWKRTMTR